MKDFDENQLNKEENINEKNDSNNQCSNEFSDEKETKDDTKKEFTEENINKEKDKKVSNKNNKEPEFSIENFRFKRYTMEDINKKFNDEIEKIKSNIRKFKSKICRNKKMVKVITITSVSVIVLFLVYGNSDIRAFSKINSLSEHSEFTSMEEDDLNKYLNKILSKNNKEKTSKILEALNKENVANEFRVITLNRVKNCNKESIDFVKIITMLNNPNNNDFINNSIIEILSLNPKEENEKAFITAYSPLINKDNKKLVQAFNKYKDNNIGTNDNIYKLDINTKDLVNCYILDTLKADDFKAFTKYKNNDETLKSFVDLSKEFINNNQYKLVLNVPTKINESEIKITDKIKPEYENINLLINTIKELEEAKNYKKTLEENHKNMPEKKKSIEISISDCKGSISSKEKEISKLEKDINEIKPFTIEGFIIGEDGDTKTHFGNAHEYEAAYIEGTPYGDFPSKDRFILNTYSTRFTSKGRFSLEVICSGEKEVKLKEEYGNFTQKWNVYEEYTGEVKKFYNEAKTLYEIQKSEIDDLNKKINNLNNELDQLNKSESNYSNNLSSTNNKIKELESKVIELKKGLTDNV